MNGKVKSEPDLLGDSKENSIKERISHFLDSVKSKATKLSTKTKTLMASVFSLSFLTSISAVSASTGTTVAISAAIPVVGWVVTGVAVGAAALSGVIKRYNAKKEGLKNKILYFVKDVFRESGYTIEYIETEILNINKDDFKKFSSPSKHLTEGYLDKFEFFIRYSDLASGDLSNPISSRSIALQLIKEYRLKFVKPTLPKNELEFWFIKEIREIIGLERFQSGYDGRIFYTDLIKPTFARELGYEFFSYTANPIRNVIFDGRAFTNTELEVIWNYIENLPEGNDNQRSLKQRALDAFNYYLSNKREDMKKYNDDWVEKLPERTVDQYILQRGLCGGDGRRISYKQFIADLHHIDYNSKNDDPMNLILLSKAWQEDPNNLDHKTKDPRHRRILLENRNKFKNGIAPHNWKSENAKRLFDAIGEDIKIRGVEEVLFGGMTRTQAIIYCRLLLIAKGRLKILSLF